MSHPNTDRDERVPERIRVCVRTGKDDWIGVAYSPDAGDPSVIHEYVRVVASAKDAEWALHELADGWISNNEREGEYGFNRNAQQVLDAIANDAAARMRDRCVQKVKQRAAKRLKEAAEVEEDDYGYSRALECAGDQLEEVASELQSLTLEVEEKQR